MKGVFHWLSMNLSRSPASETRSDQDSFENDERSANGDFQIDDLMPDIYSGSTDETAPHLRVIKGRSQATDKSTGFDPYDTAKFHKK
jgi:hypothetical protein